MEDPAPILVVDDHEDTVDMLQRLLESGGHRVVAASSALHALELLVAGLRPAVIVADERMPQVSGSELLAFLRRTQELAATPVLMLSGDELAPTADPFTVIRRKPLEPTALLDLVARLVERAP